jgi:hypothetical protein
VNLPARIRRPFLFLIVAVAMATLCAVVLQLATNIPLSPWESSIAMEAMRLNSGLPIYESGHATHMYGPLLDVLFAVVFRILGLSLPAARISMSILAIALAIFLSVILCRGKGRHLLLIAIAIFLGINFRTNLVFFSMQPDCAAALCALAALYLWITRADSFLRAAAAISLFTCAMLFKQTNAAVALVPIAHVLIWQQPIPFRRLAAAAIPTMSILLVIAAIRIFWPQMFFAIVAVPASIQIHPERAFAIAFYLVATFPLFLIAIMSILRSSGSITEIERWILSVILIVLPVSIWTMCKSGSDYNSLLLAYLAMTALFVSRLSPIVDWLRSMPILRSFFFASAMVIVVFISLFVKSNKAAALLFARHGDDKYDSAVSIARGLNGTVVAPQDPTIPYRAKKFFGRSLFFELDTHAVNGNWPDELPESILQELAQAKHVITVRSFVPTPVFERSLPQNGFHQVSFPELQDSAYTVWSKN